MTKILLTWVLLITQSFAQTFNEAPYRADIPLIEGDREFGEVNAELKGSEVLWVDKKVFIELLRPNVKSDTLKVLERLPDQITPANLPFPLKFNPEKFVLETRLPFEQKSTASTDLGNDLEEKKHEALAPSPFGGAINYRVEQNWGSEAFGGNNLGGQFNSFLNLRSVVLENQTYYQSNNQNEWFRGDTRLVKDFQKDQIRVQLGDVYPLIQGFMVARPLGGVNAHRNFSLNPYRLPYPTGNQEFTIRSRSLVKYYVNSVLIKSEYLPAGTYSAKNIPLTNGLNTIMIETTDDLGQKRVFTFRTSSSINLLNRAESRFDLSYGTPFLDNNFKRDYIDAEGKLLSGFYQYGFSSTFSSSLYLQNQLDFNLIGMELIQATTIGNFSYGHAESLIASDSGRAEGFTYQLITQGENWFDSHTIGLRYEARSEEFRNSRADSPAVVQNLYAANYTIPVNNHFTVALGGNYGDVRNNKLQDRYGWDANVSFRLLQHHNISFFAGRTRDEFGSWSDVGYVFVTFTFPETNNYISSLYDYEQKSTRLTYLRDNQNRLRTFRSQATAETSESKNFGELDVLYPTTFADFGMRFNGQKNFHTQSSDLRGAFRVNSAFVFAYDKELALGLARPIPGSFVIFKPDEALKSQKVALKSTSPYTEAETGPFGTITFNNLLAYQYRDIQLDPTYLDIGTSLTQEKFVLYPTYRSAHMIKLNERGSVVLTGRLLDAKGAPITLKVGRLNELIFFTNREGVFFIEGVEPGNYNLGLDDRDGSVPVKLTKEDRGQKDLGDLRFIEEQ